MSLVEARGALSGVFIYGLKELGYQYHDPNQL